MDTIPSPFIHQLWYAHYDVVLFPTRLSAKENSHIIALIKSYNDSIPIVVISHLANYQLIDDNIYSLGWDSSSLQIIRLLRDVVIDHFNFDEPLVKYEDVEIDTLMKTSRRKSTFLDLRAKEFQLLEYFLLNNEKVMSRIDIFDAVWDRNGNPFSNTIDVHIGLLRKKIDRPFKIKYIHTIAGFGYYFGKKTLQKK